MSDQQELEYAFEVAFEVAPTRRSLAQVGREVNERIDLDWSDAKWRGLWKDYPSQRVRCQKVLGEEQRAHPVQTIHVEGEGRGVVFGDIHAPFHDPDAIALAAKVTRWWRPRWAVFNGDDTDFAGISAFDKNPARYHRIQDEIDAWHIDVVAPLQHATGRSCRWFKTDGNHCDRLRRLVWRNPALYGLRSFTLHSLLELDKYGIEHATHSVRFSNVLEVRHGTRVSKWAGYSARAEAEETRYAFNTITGHVHRAGRFMTKTNASPSGWVQAQEGACLCYLQPDYVVDPDWVQGITLFDIRRGICYIQPVQFSHDYTCVVGKSWFDLR